MELLSDGRNVKSTILRGETLRRTDIELFCRYLQRNSLRLWCRTLSVFASSVFKTCLIFGLKFTHGMAARVEYLSPTNL